MAISLGILAVTGCAGGGSIIRPGSATSTSTSSSSSSTTTAHEVDLSWHSPSSSPDPVVGYFVYRATRGGTSFQQLNSTAVTATSYIDTTIQSGQTYDYIVVSVGASGALSDPSNLATAITP